VKAKATMEHHSPSQPTIMAVRRPPTVNYSALTSSESRAPKRRRVATPKRLILGTAARTAFTSLSQSQSDRTELKIKWNVRLVALHELYKANELAVHLYFCVFVRALRLRSHWCRYDCN